MPRIVFGSQEALIKWCEVFVKEGNYTAYLTSMGELILEPRRSTRPRRYVYFTQKDAPTVAKMISEEYTIPLFKIVRYEWDASRLPGARTRSA